MNSTPSPRTSRFLALFVAVFLAVPAFLLLAPGREAHAATKAAMTKSAAPAAPAAPGVDHPDSDKPWKVSDPHGPGKTIAFDTDEGTWLALSVHPDGTRIVFSLLGDLYMLPIGGGEAKRITSGPAYDVEPEFSPDGKWIAFASDRGGNENIWICDLDGNNARQISREKQNEVNSPAWSPDGQWIVGRRHFTDLSSLGTMELWMWHVMGGDGVQITRKEDQPQAADPAFSRDGRFIYFSARDARYRYDRNVNEGIWQLKRFDRRTGQTTQLTGEFGGAAAPTPSPDGQAIAFIRRVRAQTVLEVLDLNTGRTGRVATGLERDNQEGFAIHGVFPGYGWTPDGHSIVATADGKIWKWTVATGERAAIPFHAAVEQRVADALRTPRRVGVDPVRARIIRWPVESPDGKRLVFSALGHLYAMDLPGGTPKRLTALEDLEYSPAYSPDGRWITFVTWNDVSGGDVWVMSSDPASATASLRRVTPYPGQYVNPSFSPDGKRLVFLRGSGAWFRDENLSDDLWEEVVWSSVEGGPVHYVIGTQNRGPNRRMARPMFSPDGERIFFVEDDQQEKPSTPVKSLLVSVKPDGTDRQVHLKFSEAEEAVLSPDGRWVVFQEAHNVYVTALPQAGTRPVEVSRDSSALPLGQLSDEGGEWVSWADGGRTVTWIFGPAYRRIALDKAVPVPKEEDEAESAGSGKEKDGKDADGDTAAGGKAAGKGAAAAEASAKKGRDKAAGEDSDKKKKKELPKSDVIEIVLTVPRGKPSGTVAYTGARIVSMKGDEVIDGGTIVVDGDRIVSVGAKGAVAIPSGAKVVDLGGKTIIPGLFDEHAHLHYSTLDIFPQRPWKYLANLAYGVTSTHDPSASTQEVFGQSEMVEAGMMPGPRIFSTGYILYGADGPGKAVINSLDDARHHVRRLKSVGAFSVKSYMQPKRVQRQWVIQAAREEGMLVVPEGGGDLESDMTMILDGHTTVEHALPFVPRKDVVTLFARSGTSYTPTLLVAYGGLSGEHWFYQHYEVWKDERLLRYTPQGVVDARARIRPVMATDEDWHHIDVARGAKQVLEAGGRVCLGGHGQLQGLGPHWEMWAFVQAGMTPMEALRVATRLPAETLGLDKDLGSIEPGKLADFVVLDRNPLEKIENSDSISLVVKNGVAWRPEDLARTLPEPPDRPLVKSE